MNRRCPVCLQPVRPTRRGYIAGHFDTIGKPCRGNGEPYQIALLTSRPARKADAP